MLEGWNGHITWGSIFAKKMRECALGLMLEVKDDVARPSMIRFRENELCEKWLTRIMSPTSIQMCTGNTNLSHALM